MERVDAKRSRADWVGKYSPKKVFFGYLAGRVLMTF
jgi:hypothetical protein